MTGLRGGKKGKASRFLVLMNDSGRHQGGTREEVGRHQGETWENPDFDMTNCSYSIDYFRPPHDFREPATCFIEARLIFGICAAADISFGQ
jgi:hypothetical protein